MRELSALRRDGGLVRVRSGLESVCERGLDSTAFFREISDNFRRAVSQKVNKIKYLTGAQKRTAICSVGGWFHCESPMAETLSYRHFLLSFNIGSQLIAQLENVVIRNKSSERAGTSRNEQIALRMQRRPIMITADRAPWTLGRPTDAALAGPKNVDRRF